MNIKEIRQLVKLMMQNELTELNVEEGENRIHLKRQGEQVFAAPPAPAPAAPATAPAGPAPAETAPAEEPEAPSDLVDVKSPMVGTFYTAPSPDSEPFVTEGDSVEPETVVCVVEAMKVMNEIKAECAGTVVEVCAQNAQPVEYGQPLFRVKPA